jgi:hypothetical protein
MSTTTPITITQPTVTVRTKRYNNTGREYGTFYGDLDLLRGWQQVNQDEALAQPDTVEIMYVDRDQAGPSYWVCRPRPITPTASKAAAWFAQLSRDDRKTVLNLLHELRTLCEKRTEGANASMRQLDLVLGLLRALDEDHQSLKPENQRKSVAP